MSDDNDDVPGTSISVQPSSFAGVKKFLKEMGYTKPKLILDVFLAASVVALMPSGNVFLFIPSSTSISILEALGPLVNLIIEVAPVNPSTIVFGAAAVSAVGISVATSAVFKVADWIVHPDAANQQRQHHISKKRLN